jgi:FMN-dependent oxidoreductase (nitrilotriacetate monooxygenase family)
MTPLPHVFAEQYRRSFKYDKFLSPYFLGTHNYDIFLENFPELSTMPAKKQLHFNAFMRPATIHTGGWRYPGGYPDANFNLNHIVRFIKKLEEGKFDTFFMADHLALLNMPIEALQRSATPTSFEPMTLLSALAMVTNNIGLIATSSTTYDAPYHVARRFASLDHISGGRAGWNIVTTANPNASKNFGIDIQMEHDERYKRAREFHDVVTGLWDSWDDDAFIRDANTGIFFKPEKMHVLDHDGKYLKSRGPLNIARPIQGWPIIVQAGASNAGRQLAAETAEIVFTSQPTLKHGQEFYADVKKRMQDAGRNPNHMYILPACMVIIADTLEKAREQRAKLDSLVHFESAMASLSIALGTDASAFDPEKPLPKIPETNAGQSSREKAIKIAEEEGLTVRQLAQRMGGHSSLCLMGPPELVADQMENWLSSKGSDGFTIQFPHLPQGLDDFVDLLVPVLQRRGIYREDYKGKTLRENLGLPRPTNRFFRKNQLYAQD